MNECRYQTHFLKQVLSNYETNLQTLYAKIMYMRKRTLILQHSIDRSFDIGDWSLSKQYSDELNKLVDEKQTLNDNIDRLAHKIEIVKQRIHMYNQRSTQVT